MFKTEGMVLKSGVHVGLGEMPRVPGFGEKAQVGELEFLYQQCRFIKHRSISSCLRESMKKKKTHQDNLER